MSGLLPLWAPGTRKGLEETTGLLSRGGGGGEQIVLTDCMTEVQSSFLFTQAFPAPFWSSFSFLPGSGPSLFSILCGCT